MTTYEIIVGKCEQDLIDTPTTSGADNHRTYRATDGHTYTGTHSHDSWHVCSEECRDIALRDFALAQSVGPIPARSGYIHSAHVRRNASDDGFEDATVYDWSPSDAAPEQLPIRCDVCDKRLAGYVTIHDLAIYRGMVSTTGNPDSFSGGDYAAVRLAIMGGCGGCGASLAAYNGHPSKAGTWRCGDCIEGVGWTDVAEANEDIFEEDA